MTLKLPTGKIVSETLNQLLTNYTGKDERVVIGAGVGEDATVIDMGDRYLVAKTDPITHVTGEIGYYVVNINANDIAAMGGKPLWFLVTILVPEGSDAEGLERIFRQISRSCHRMGVVYCGGHTEVTGCVDRPVVIGQMLGEMNKSQLKPSCGAKAGDELLMTKWAGIEGTAIMAQEKETELRRHFAPELLRRARNYLHDPGISVVREALLVNGSAGVHALHDPTEGGIATGVFEMAAASDLGVELHYDKIPVSQETRQLCGFFEVDPLGIFASGALLMAVAHEEAGAVAAKLETEGIPAARIGVMTPREEGRKLIKAGKSGPLPVYHQDELSRIFG